MMKKQFKDILLATLIALSIGVLFYFTNSNNSNFIRFLTFFIFVSLSFAVPSIVLNGILGKKQGYTNIKKIILINLLVNLFISIMVAYGEMLVFWKNKIDFLAFLELKNTWSKVFLYTFIALWFFFLFYAKGLYQSLKNSIQREEHLKKEQLKTELLLLKAQFNPHFLFNNLNVLQALIDQNPEKAKLFTQDLSSIYRYILTIKDQQKTTVQAELEFANKYIELLKKRFGESLILTVNVKHTTKKIIPLSVQVALENVIKHNQFSLENPIKITISESENGLIIRNDYRFKTALYSEKNGLENLKKRYQLFFKTLKWEQNETHFTLYLPYL